MESGQETTPAPVAVSRPPRLARGELRTAAALIVVLAGVGALIGLLWSAVSPHVQVVITPSGPDLASYESDTFFAAEGTFLFLGLGVGLLAGVATWLLRRYRGPVLLGALVIGCLIGSYLAWQVGSHLGLAHYDQLLHSTDVGKRFGKPVDLRGRGVLYAQALAGAVIYLVLAAWSARPDLHRGDSVAAEAASHGR